MHEESAVIRVIMPCYKPGVGNLFAFAGFMPHLRFQRAALILETTLNFRHFSAELLVKTNKKKVFARNRGAF